MTTEHLRLRFGLVTDVDWNTLMARVKFLDDGTVTSDWLKVGVHFSFFHTYDGTQQTEHKAGGSGWPEYESHAHTIKKLDWMPAVNEQVAVLWQTYEHGGGADGLILCGVKTGGR